jgi:hypothetical protein
MTVPAIASVLLHAAAMSVVVAATAAKGAEPGAARPPTVPVEVVEFDSSPPEDERVAISGEVGKEDRAQGRPDASPEVDPSPSPPPRVEARARRNPANDTAPHGPRPAPTTSRPARAPKTSAKHVPEPGTERDEDPPAPTSMGATAAAGAAATRAASSGNEPGEHAAERGRAGERGDGGGELRNDAPSLVGRFGHELPRIGASVPGWQDPSAGPVPPVEVELVLGEDGHLDRGRNPFVRVPELGQELLAETVRRTCRSLFGAFSVPGQGSRGAIRLRIGATVSDVAPTRLTIDGSDPRAPSFTLESGRRIDFAVEVVSSGRAELPGEPP